MDGILYKDLMESYKSVHEEGDKWIQGAIKKPGALHKELGVPEDKKIPKGKLEAAAKKGGMEGKRARLAMTLEKLPRATGPRTKKESFEGWVDFLLAEGEDLSDMSAEELFDIFEEGDCDSKEHEEEEKEEQKDRKKIRKMLDKEDEKEEEMGEGIDFKGAAREQARRDAIQAEKDKKSPSSKDRRLAMGKFRPGASAAERAEGGRDAMREKGTSPTKNGKKMFEAFQEAYAEMYKSEEV
jgi:hypothetical protein